ncbi:MAG: VWA domain-containing protein [Bacteroidetes bacterium]|nr:VWA domain-containing protein [Bacteroidota bacterium]MBM3455631.1 VWA domain-containing protein [Bacteroidota bacterium]
MWNNWNVDPWSYNYFQPFFLWLLFLLPFIGWLLIRKEFYRKADLSFSIPPFIQRRFESTLIGGLRTLIIFLKLGVFALFILILAKPFRWKDSQIHPDNYSLGIDIVLAIDVSLSMRAKDFSPNRLEAAKNVAYEFIEQREGDRIGFVAYAGEAFTACAPTLDYEQLKSKISEIDGFEMEQGTAIGTGLGTAVLQLRSDTLKSKVIILLTDGMNNAGELSPLAAAELAKSKNICVYTIGIGSMGKALTPVITPFGLSYEYEEVEIDEGSLKKIADQTGGKYFRAIDRAGLSKIYQRIDKMEKQKMSKNLSQIEPPTTPYAFLNWLLLFVLIIFIFEFGFFTINRLNK